MKKIKVIVNNKEYDFDKGISLLEISREIYKSKFPVLVAFIDNEIFSLDKKVNSDCTVRFVNVLDPVGNRIYQKGLLFVLVYAFKELFGYDYYVKACHSIDKAIKLRTNLHLNHDRIKMLKSKMREIIDADMPITKCLVSRKEARKYFESTFIMQKLILLFIILIIMLLCINLVICMIISFQKCLFLLEYLLILIYIFWIKVHLFCNFL